MGISGLNIKTLGPKSGAADAISINKSLGLKITIIKQSKTNKVGFIMFPFKKYINKLRIQVFLGLIFSGKLLNSKSYASSERYY
jgi:hypothetical protein